MSKNYADDVFNLFKDEHMTPELWQLAYSDANDLDYVGVKNDRERNLFFYIQNFADDILEELDLKVEDINETIKNVFNKLKNKEKVDLLDIRKAFFDVAGKKISKKVAYPNTLGVNETNMMPLRETDKWVDALYQIYNYMYNGESRDLASKKVTEGWDPMSKLDFNNWAKFYEEGNHEKYNIKTASPMNVEDVPNNPIPEVLRQDSLDKKIENFLLEPEPEVLNIEQQQIKQRGLKNKSKEEIHTSLVSRLDSASKLLREFVNVWPKDVWHDLSQALSDLKREIVGLKSQATMEDCIIRTANIWEIKGFSEGAGLLRKIAAPDDIASEVDKALSGGDEKEETSPVLEEMPTEEVANMPPAGAGEELPPPEEPPVPTPLPEEPPAPEPKEKELDFPDITPTESKSTNPYVGKTVDDALGVLEPIAQQLSERKIVRELAKTDMILDALNVASHFPELSEAMAKMLEANNYVLSRLEKVISKLKGGLKEEEDEKAEPPAVEMTELENAPAMEPAAPVQPEKEMFEVTEEPEAPVGEIGKK